MHCGNLVVVVEGDDLVTGEKQQHAKMAAWSIGNPSGRRKEVGPVRELAKQYTEAAIDTLAKVMEDPNAPSSARVAAAEALLARGWASRSRR